MKRTCCALFLVMSTCSTLARAADDPPERLTVIVVPEADAGARPRMLVGLYAASGVLQAYDAYSTLAGVKMQKAELNPFLSGMVKQPALFIAAKGAMTIATIATADRLWRSHHRGRAIALMAVSNGLMAVVAARNASTLRAQR